MKLKFFITFASLLSLAQLAFQPSDAYALVSEDASQAAPKIQRGQTTVVSSILAAFLAIDRKAEDVDTVIRNPASKPTAVDASPNLEAPPATHIPTQKAVARSEDPIAPPDPKDRVIVKGPDSSVLAMFISIELKNQLLSEERARSPAEYSIPVQNDLPHPQELFLSKQKPSPPADRSGDTFIFFSGYHQTSLQATDLVTSAQAQVNTQYDFDAAATWIRCFSSFISGVATVGVRTLTFASSENADKSLNQTNKNMAHVSVGGIGHIGDWLDLKLVGSYGEQLFMYGSDVHTVTIDQVGVPSATFGLTYRAWRTERTSLEFELNGSMLAGGESTKYYSIQPGSSLSEAISLEQYLGKSHNTSLKFTLEHSQRDQSTSLVQQQEIQNTIGAALSISFDGKKGGGQ